MGRARTSTPPSTRFVRPPRGPAATRTASVSTAAVLRQGSGEALIESGSERGPGPAPRTCRSQHAHERFSIGRRGHLAALEVAARRLPNLSPPPSWSVVDVTARRPRERCTRGGVHLRRVVRGAVDDGAGRMTSRIGLVLCPSTITDVEVDPVLCCGVSAAGQERRPLSMSRLVVAAVAPVDVVSVGRRSRHRPAASPTRSGNTRPTAP